MKKYSCVTNKCMGTLVQDHVEVKDNIRDFG